jgi:hypothetical protein
VELSQNLFGEAKCKKGMCTLHFGEEKIKQENNYFWVENKVV